MRYVSILLLLFACALGAGETKPKPQVQPRTAPQAGGRILDGTNVAESQFPTVGRVGDANGEFCTGTLIAPNVVLCAAHCVADDNGQQTLGDTAGRVSLGGVSYRTRRVIIHPTYRGFAGTTEGQFDISLLFLEQNVPGITPTPLYRQAPTQGQTLTIAGFGSQGSGTTGPNNTFPQNGTINFGSTPIDEVSPTFIAWRFDEGESNTAPGDSGGPAFLTVNGVRQLAGVTSGGSTEGAFGDFSFDVRVDAVAAWIDTQIQNDGNPGTPGTPGTPPPTQPPPAGNSFAFISLPAATPNPAQARQTVQFFCAVNAAATFDWEFGDGTEDFDAEETTSHTFNAAGTYQCFVTATRESDGVRLTGTITVTVNGANAEELSVDKGRFVVNFQNPSRSKLDVTLYSPEFVFDDKRIFQAVISGERVRVRVGDGDTDELVMSNTAGIGGNNSTLKWNPRTGQIKYSLRGFDVMDYLERFGVIDDDVDFEEVTVPFEIEIGGVNFAGDYTFFYRARAGRSGTGK